MDSLSIKDDDDDDDAKLEAVAVAFQEEMYKQNLVKDRIYHLKTYRDCFTGRDAVTVLVQVLQQQQQQKREAVVTREDALQVGRNIAATFGLLAHVVDDHLLQDTDGLFFEFRNNLPSVVQQALQNKQHTGMPLTLWEQLEQFETLVRDTITQDRTYHFRTYKQCFVGTEAVNAMMQQLKFTISRSDAVQLIQQFVNQGDALEHVCKDHDFKDKYLFYRFIPNRHRKLNPTNRRSSVMAFADGMMMSAAGADGLDFSHSITSSVDEDMSEVGSSSDHGGSLLDRRVSSTAAASRQRPLVVDLETLRDIAHRMESELEIANHRYRFKIYKNCFVAKNAVTYLVQSGFADSRPHAERIGQDLETHLNLFHHVCREHGFRDKFYFFRFTPPDERIVQQPVDPTTAITSSSISEQDDPTGRRGEDDGQQTKPRQLTTRLGVVKALQDARLTIEGIAKVFETGVKVKDEYYHLKLYKNVFRGKRAVDLLVSLRSVCTNRRDAVLLGRLLAEKCHLFEHIAREHDLVDDDFFYQFVPVEERQKRLGASDLVVETSTTTATILEQLMENDDALRSEGALRSEDGEDGDHGTDKQQQSPPDERLMEVAMLFRAGVKIADNRYRGKVHKKTFVGSQAVNFLVNSSLASSRKEAVKLGRRLANEMYLFEHVHKKHPFSDDFYCYRFIENAQDTKHDSKGCLITSFFSSATSLSSSAFNNSETSFSDDIGSVATPSGLIKAAQAMEEGLTPRDHRFHLRVYKNTVLGSEVVDLLLAGQHASSRPQAVQLGRAVCREFQLLEHVTLDHGIKDERLFYKFVTRPNRIKGKWFEESHQDKVKDKMIIVGKKRSHCSIEEYWNMVMNMVERDIWKFQLESIVSKPVREFHVESEDHEWAKRVKDFELRQSKLPRLQMSSTLTFTPETTLSSLCPRMPYRMWSRAFRKLDPRYQIMDFFTEVARTGTQPIEEGLTNHAISLLDEIRPLLRFFPLNLASVFTVWRPTSYDAIRKMMTGDAVGKGLDIKGKSAKRGKLSGFVPFLQIGRNKHKKKIRRLCQYTMVRVFYGPDGRRARDKSMTALEAVADDMLQTVEEARKVLAMDPNRVDSKMYENALESMQLHMHDPTITPIDDYAPLGYGLEIPEKLLWEAYFVRQDCTREPGSMYDTGRASTPAFQDMNFSAMRDRPKEDGMPRIVLFHNAADDPMNPFELLMAYEENGRVRPVVSDFDCFLVGTRRVHFCKPLPANQLEVLKWCVNKIEILLQKMIDSNDNSASRKPWSHLWLGVMKEAAQDGFHPEIPRFGFGDEVSYSIMESAVHRLRLTGAVRHGAESFNYYFPQDLDDEFLVISDDINGKGNLLWKYVGVDELQDFLLHKAENGYSFPLNPKWVLVDAGWKDLYDKLLKSENVHVQAAMDVWYPPESGLREQIDRIYELRKQLDEVEI